MQQDGPRTPYEVYCHHCNVTAPAGTRRCVHCGGRLAPERARITMRLPSEAEEVAVDESMPRRPGAFSPFTLVWILLLLGGYLYRSCAG